MLLSIFGKGSTEPQKGPVTYCSYREAGMRHATEYIYEQKEDGTCTLSLKEGWNDDNIHTIAVPATIGDELWKLAQQYGMCKYKDSYTPKGRVLDGTMWRISMKFTEGDKLYTGGENAWPSGGGVDKLSDYLESVWKQYRPKIQKFEYRYMETTAFPRYHVLIAPDKEGVYWMTNGSNCSTQDARKAKLPQEAYDELYYIIDNYHMRDYQRDYMPEYEVFDGYMWTLYVYFGRNEKSVYSSGHNAAPGDNGLQRLEKFIDKWWEQLQPKSEPGELEW